MRVLHVTWAFSPLTETFVYDLVREVAGLADSLVVTQARLNAGERPFEPVALIEGPRGLAILRDLIAHRLSRAMAPGPGFRTLRGGLLAAARRFRPDVLHAHFGDSGVLAAPVARRLGVPLVTSFYGVDASERARDLRWREWYRPLAEGRNRVLALSRVMREDLVSAGLPAKRIEVLATGKRLAEYAFRERRARPERLVTVGRLVEKKGHADAIEALARLAREGERLALEVIGEGPLEGALRARIEALGLGGRVRLLGALDHEATRTRMAASDAFLLASRTASSGDREGVPTVLMEAQALGLPCVSTLHAGIPEAIPVESHFLLAPEGDVEALAAALRWLRAAPGDELAAVSRRGRAHVEANYDVARQAKRLVACYEAALGD